MINKIKVYRSRSDLHIWIPAANTITSCTHFPNHPHGVDRTWKDDTNPSNAYALARLSFTNGTAQACVTLNEARFSVCALRGNAGWQFALARAYADSNCHTWRARDDGMRMRATEYTGYAGVGVCMYVCLEWDACMLFRMFGECIVRAMRGSFQPCAYWINVPAQREQKADTSTTCAIQVTSGLRISCCARCDVMQWFRVKWVNCRLAMIRVRMLRVYQHVFASHN